MSTLIVSNISDGTFTVDASYVAKGSAKALVNSEQNGNINTSFNISSGTYHATGDYSYALTSGFPSRTSYSMQVNVRSTAIDRQGSNNASRDTASVIATETGDMSTGLNDQDHQICVFGDLA